MKKLYKKTQEDVQELCEILLKTDESGIEVSAEPQTITTASGKTVEAHEVIINGEKTYFTAKLVAFLVERQAIERV